MVGIRTIFGQFAACTRMIMLTESFFWACILENENLHNDTENSHLVSPLVPISMNGWSGFSFSPKAFEKSFDSAVYRL